MRPKPSSVGWDAAPVALARPAPSPQETPPAGGAARRREPRRGAGAGPAAAYNEARRAELERLHAEGRRLHAEDERLRAERARGVVDRAAHDRWFAQMAAHREALRRFRTGR
jgi:hypothetical protein